MLLRPLGTVPGERPRRGRLGRKVADQDTETAPGEPAAAEVPGQVELVVAEEVGLEAVLVVAEDGYEAEDSPTSSWWLSARIAWNKVVLPPSATNMSNGSPPTMSRAICSNG